MQHAVWRGVLCGLCAIILSWGARPPAMGGEGSLPDVIGSFRWGPEPAPGQWAEYRLALPLDPLEARLEEEAARIARALAEARREAASDRPRGTEESAEAADAIGLLSVGDSPPSAARAPIPPPPPARPGMDQPGQSGQPGQPGQPAAPPNIHPSDRLPDRWRVIPLRLLVTAVRGDAVEVEFRTEGGTYKAVWPRDPVPADSPGLGVRAPGGAEGSETAARAKNVMVDGQALTVLATPLGHIDADDGGGGDPAEAGECWVSERVPFGLARFWTPRMDLALVGFGLHDAVAFPMDRVDLPENFPEG